MVHNFVAQIEVEIIVMKVSANFELKKDLLMSKKKGAFEFSGLLFLVEPSNFCVVSLESPLSINGQFVWSIIE